MAGFQAPLGGRISPPADTVPKYCISRRTWGDCEPHRFVLAPELVGLHKDGNTAKLGKNGTLYIARVPYQGKDDKRFLERSDLGDTRAAMHGIKVAVHGVGCVGTGPRVRRNRGRTSIRLVRTLAREGRGPGCLAGIRTFAGGLKQDEAAVKGVWSLAYSDNQTEVQINPLDSLKRQMCRWAGFESLRSR